MARAYTYENKPTSNTSTRAHYGGSKKPKGITIHHWGSTGQKHENVVRWLRGAAGGVNNRNSSAHYVVSAGLVTQLADDSVATWHAGNTRGNGDTIGIECRPEMSDGDYATLVQLCADLEEKHGSLKYYGHKDWKNTACPGKWYGKVGQLVKDINAEHAARKKGGGRKPNPGGGGSSKPSKPKRPVGNVPGSGTPFPLNAAKGEYFGPKSGPDRSYSGLVRRTVKGKDASEWIKEWVNQLVRRGWNAKKGGTYLTQFGNDGKYGTEFRTLIRAFQKDQGLPVDGFLGKDTWDAAFQNPVT